jgi:NADPH2:quinone reductase
VISVHVGQTYPLQDAARAHRDLESRQTTGSTVLLI